MLYLLLSICCSTILLINFRVFPKFGINTYQAIALNYTTCFATGLFLMPQGQSFSLDLSQNWTWYCFLLGVGFIITFILSGLSTQKMGITATSLANNVSLVIPVLVSLFLLKTSGKVFNTFNYLGLAFAVIAVALSAIKKENSQRDKSAIYLPIAVFIMYGITNSAINYLNLTYIPNPELTIPVTLVMVLGAMIAGYVLLIFRIIRNKEKIAFKNIIASISLGIPNFLSFYLLILALTSFGNSGAYVYPLFNIGVILLSSFVAILIFKEKLNTLNKLGLILALIAIYLISYQELFLLF